MNLNNLNQRDYDELVEKAEKYDNLMKANSQVVKDNINITKEHQIVERLEKYRDMAKSINDHEMETICNEILKGKE